MELGSWLRQTRQTWKIYVFLTLCALQIVLVAFTITHTDDARSYLSTILCATIALGWIACSLSCAACSGRPGWSVIKTRDVASWLPRLLFLNRCPLCGHSGAVASGREQAEPRDHSVD